MGVAQSVVLQFNGQPVTFYRTGYVAGSLGRDPQTIRKWELAGTIPKTPFRDKSGRRLYTQEHVDALVDCCVKHQIMQGKSISRTGFTREIYNRFNEINARYTKKGEDENA